MLLKWRRLRNNEIKRRKSSLSYGKEISKVLLTEVKDEDLKNVTITYATVTNDLSSAKVYFTTLDDEKRDKVIKDMKNASSYFRTELASRLNLRHMPEINFIYDTSIEYGRKIEKIIEEINSEN